MKLNSAMIALALTACVAGSAFAATEKAEKAPAKAPIAITKTAEKAPAKVAPVAKKHVKKAHKATKPAAKKIEKTEAPKAETKK